MYDIEAELEKEDECVFLPDGNHQQQLSALAPQTVERGGCCHCLLDQQGGVRYFHGKVLLNIPDISGTVAWCLCRSSVKI